MRLKLCFIFLLFYISANTKAGWLCHEASSMREGRILTTCGIGYGKNEAQARENALEKAYKELDSICDRSVDCKNQELYIEPLRNECLFEEKQYKCYRGITATITKRKRPKEKQTQKERSKERIEVIIKNEIIQQEKVTAYSCDYNYGKVESHLKENQITKAVKLIKEVPFKLKCSQLHYKFMRTLVKLNKFPSSYVSYLYSLVSTFEGDWNDHRPTAIFDYLYQKGDWDIRGWKRIYLAVKSTSPGKFYRYSTLLFHLDSKSQKTQSDRLIGLLEDIKNQRIGFPDKLSFQKAFTSLLCRVPKDESHFWFWEVLFTSFEKTKPKISRSKDILNCLKKSQKWNLSEKEKKQVTTWISDLIATSDDIEKSRDFLIDYIRDIDQKLKRLDETIREEEIEIQKLREEKIQILSLSKAHLSKLFSKAEKKFRRKNIIEFCLKENLKCPIIPSYKSIKKRLQSKKKKTVEETTHFLTMMPETSYKLKDELLSLIENHNHYRVRSNSIEALIKTPISEKEELDILLKHSWKKSYDYQDLAKVLGKRLLVSLLPIASNKSHRNRDLAIEMIGLIGNDAKEAVPILENILKEKPHYSTADRVKKALSQIKE